MLALPKYCSNVFRLLRFLMRNLFSFKWLFAYMECVFSYNCCQNFLKFIIDFQYFNHNVSQCFVTLGLSCLGLGELLGRVKDYLFPQICKVFCNYFLFFFFFYPNPLSPLLLKLQVENNTRLFYSITIGALFIF